MTITKTFERRGKKAHHISYCLADCNHTLYLNIRDGEIKYMRHRITLGEVIYKEREVKVIPPPFRIEVDNIIQKLKP